MREKTIIPAVFASALTFLCLLPGCEIKDPVVEVSFVPMLSEMTVPETLYLRSDRSYLISVKVSDPQGIQDVSSVRYYIFSENDDNPLSEGMLRDDGMDGDIIPHDGLFIDSLSVDFAGGQAGVYRLSMVAEDQSANVSDSLHADLDVVDGELNLPPSLSNPVIPDSLDQFSTADVFISIQADDPQGLNDIDSVFFQMYPPYHPEPSYQTRLVDDGLAGDIAADDGVFTVRMDMSDILTQGGDYTVRFQATDRGSLESDPVVRKITMTLTGNQPPVLSNLSAPDIISRSVPRSFLISVQVDDPQGPDDIRIVYFNSTKPDGSPASGNPFIMADDGSSGDVQAGDGIYSLTIQITLQNDVGVYRFDFFAEDFGGAVSDPLVHYITVTI